MSGWRLYEWRGDQAELVRASAEDRMAPDMNLPPVEPNGWLRKHMRYHHAEHASQVEQFLHAHDIHRDTRVSWELVTKNVLDGVPVMFTSPTGAVIGVLAA